MLAWFFGRQLWMWNPSVCKLNPSLPGCCQCKWNLGFQYYHCTDLSAILCKLNLHCCGNDTNSVHNWELCRLVVVVDEFQLLQHYHCISQQSLVLIFIVVVMIQSSVQRELCRLSHCICNLAINFQGFVSIAVLFIIGVHQGTLLLLVSWCFMAIHGFPILSTCKSLYCQGFI